MSSHRIERLLNLLTLLLNARRPISVREIGQHPEFSVYCSNDVDTGDRAFERDKAALLDMGVPIRYVPPEQTPEDDTEGIGGYVIDREQFYLPDIKLDSKELALLSIAGTAAAAMQGFPGRTAVVRALAKLGFDVDEARPTPSLAHAPVREEQISSHILNFLEILREAIARRRVVRMVYKDLAGHVTRRLVDPYGLFYRRGIWYLVGYCHLRKAERTFRLGRAQKIIRAHPDRLKPEFDVPEDFDLATHVHRQPWEYPQHKAHSVKIRVASRLVPAIAEIFGRHVRMAKQGKKALVTVLSTHDAALVSAILPFGSGIEILSPAPLRKRIQQTYEQIANVYSHAKQRNAPAHKHKEKKTQ